MYVVYEKKSLTLVQFLERVTRNGQGLVTIDDPRSTEFSIY